MQRPTLVITLMFATAALAWLIVGIVREPVPAWTPPEAGVEPIGPGRGFLRGAHWFGDAWAVNYWNTRLLDQATQDFTDMRADGFNTVILVIPWAGFVASPNSGALNPERVKRLVAILDIAEEVGLNVVLRLGYAWDAAIPRSGGWSVRLWLDEAVHQSWLDHLSALWDVVGQRTHVRFGFISWEDFWAIHGAGYRELPRRLLVAEESGYRSWLKEQFSLAEVGERYGRSFSTWKEVPVPRRDELAFGLFFDFMDHAWIERFFKPAQRVFPRLSMEIRVDGDAIMDGSGELAYYHRHHSAWDLPGAEWTTVYWSPAMEGVNQGETLSPQIAAQRLADQLSKISDLTNDRPIFIDQFLVQDFTPGFEQQGRLKPERVTDFLQRTAPVLRRHAHGYALWAWRDYRHNAVPSPDFLEAENGWQLAPDAAAVADLLPFHFEPGQVLTRSFNAYEFHAGGNPRLAQLCVHAEADGDEAVDLRVIWEENALSVDVSGQGTACVDLPMADPMALTIEALSPLRLLQLELFAFTHTIGIRDLGGAPKPGMSDWRQLNARLVDAIP